MFIWMYTFLLPVLQDQLPCVTVMPDMVKSKEPQERKSSLALSLYFKNSSKNMAKEKNAHFLLVEGGCEQLYLPLIKEDDFLMLGSF